MDSIADLIKRSRLAGKPPSSSALFGPDDNKNRETEKAEGTEGTEGTTQPNKDLAVPQERKGEGTQGTLSLVTPLNRPSFHVYDTAEPFGRAGVYFHDVKASGRGEGVSPVDLWICGPLYVEAQTRDRSGGGFGRLLRFQDTLGHWHNETMPQALLKGSGEELRGLLLSKGLAISLQHRKYLTHYIQAQQPERALVSTGEVGWFRDRFVLPDQVIGGTGDVLFQSEYAQQSDYAEAGTLSDWQQQVASLCMNNPVLSFSLSTAFAGPLLRLLHLDGGGIHWFGNSSIGKTTALRVAGSVWGGGSFVRSWLATANGMEAVAVMSNDNLLPLDEISQCDPREVSTIIYCIANGVGKTRANKAGDARSARSWRVMVLSNGERTIESHLAEGGKTAKAGQFVRLLDIPVNRTYGLFDDLRGRQDGAQLANDLNAATKQHYGTAGRAFLEQLIPRVQAKLGFKQQFDAIKEHFPTADLDTQAKRAAERFALIAFAGELATAFGVTGWEEGEAIKGALTAFDAWRDHRGKGNIERNQILRRVYEFATTYGESRFTALTDRTNRVHERAGYIDERDGKRVYLFLGSALREALKGYEFRQALDVLENEKWLLPCNQAREGKRSHRVDVGGHKLALYQIVLGEIDDP